MRLQVVPQQIPRAQIRTHAALFTGRFPDNPCLLFGHHLFSNQVMVLAKNNKTLVLLRNISVVVIHNGSHHRPAVNYAVARKVVDAAPAQNLHNRNSHRSLDGHRTGNISL